MILQKKGSSAMFIGRETELKFLEDKYNEKKGQLIVLYGRRRVGKTETLREFCRDKPHIFFLHAKYGQSAAFKIFKAASAGGYPSKKIYFRIYGLGKSIPRNPGSAIRRK